MADEAFDKAIQDAIAFSLIGNEAEVKKLKETLAKKLGLKEPTINSLVEYVAGVNNISIEKAREVIRDNCALMRIAFILA